MKIAICTHKFVPPFVGGVDVYTDRLRRAFKRLGYEVIVIAFDAAADAGSEAITVCPDEYDGDNIWRVKFSFARRPKETFDHAYDPEMGVVVKNILQEQKPDLFIMMNFYKITLAPVETAKSLGIPVVHIATDFIPVCRRATFIRWDDRSCQAGESIKSCSACFVSHRPLGRLAAFLLNNLPEETLVRLANNPASYKFPNPLWAVKSYWSHVAITEKRLKIVRPLRQKIDLILTPTKYTRDVFLANGFKPEQVYLVPFGVDAASSLTGIRYTPSAYSRFLFIGRLQPYKGAHLLVEAFNNLSSPAGATLTVYGGPDGHEAYFTHLKMMMAANERIRFSGEIALDKIGQAFADADYFVLPVTWHENSPLILLDALQARTPVIASQVGGVTDIIKDGVNGLLFPMGDKHALQAVMQRVIDQPTLREQLEPRADLPGIDKYAQTIVELYQNQLKLKATQPNVVN